MRWAAAALCGTEGIFVPYLRAVCQYRRSLAAIVVLCGCCTTAWPSCTGNPVYCENQQAGTTAWQLNTSSTYSAQTLSGYASAPSVALGESISFYIRSPGPYTIQIFRIGYYQGKGARLLDTDSQASGQSQPNCRWLEAGTANEYYSCDNWTNPVQYFANPSWVSGVYLALLTATSANVTYQYHIPFVVRDDRRPADFIYQWDVATDQAYNGFRDNGFTPASFPLSVNYGTTSLYTGGTLPNYSNPDTGAPLPANVVYKASFDRPFGRIDTLGLYRYEQPFITWLEQQGFNTVYTTDIDTHEGHETLRNYRGFLVAGHSEYWSKRMYDAVQNARNDRVNLAFFSGDSIYWQVRFERNAAGVADRIIVCFRHPNPIFPVPATFNGARLIQVPASAADPSTDPAVQTIFWRDPPVARDEQTLVGIHMPKPPNEPSVVPPISLPQPVAAWISFPHGSLVVHPPQPMIVQNHRHWVYAGTGLAEGDTVPGVYGQEGSSFEVSPTAPLTTYEFLDPPFQPPGARAGTFTMLSSSPFAVPGIPAPESIVNSTIYQACSGAWVFAAGSMMWGNALAASPPVSGSISESKAAPLLLENYANPAVQQMSANILNVFNGSVRAPKSELCPVVQLTTGPAFD
jgi:hypothetical protein